MIRFVWLAGFLIGLSGVPLSAHPHVWIDVKAEVVVEAGQIRGVWADWTFDDLFSQTVLVDVDPDNTGKITDAMNEAIKTDYFENLGSYDYFCHFVAGKRDLKVPEPRRFQASITPEGRLRYRFYFPLSLALGAAPTFSLSFYDSTYYTDLAFVKTDPVRVTGGNATFVFKSDRSKAYYDGLVTPVYAVITWGRADTELFGAPMAP